MITTSWTSLKNRLSSPESSSVPPVQAQRLSDEGEDMCLLQDGLARGLPCPVTTAGVDPDQQRLHLLWVGAHGVLQGGDELQSVEGDHAVVVVRRQQQDGWVRRTRVGRLWEVVERRVPGHKRTT